MSLEWQARSGSLAWSNPVSWWWGLLTLVSGINIAVWFALYRELPPAGRAPAAASGIGMMLLFCAAVCLRLRLQVISAARGRAADPACSTPGCRASWSDGRWRLVAEIAFVAQWAILLHQLGTMTGAETTVNAAWVIVPLILIAECLSWYAVLTRNYLGNAIENSLWAVAFFAVGVGAVPAAAGIPRRRPGVVLAVADRRPRRPIWAFLDDDRRADVPEALADRRGRRRQATDAARRACATSGTRWVVTHDLAEWKDEMAWMALYFSLAVWSSLALCVVYALEHHLPSIPHRTRRSSACRQMRRPPTVPTAGAPTVNISTPDALRKNARAAVPSPLSAEALRRMAA